MASFVGIVFALAAVASLLALLDVFGLLGAVAWLVLALLLLGAYRLLQRRTDPGAVYDAERRASLSK